ncbi:hypothetical protein [Photorhabdus antumapuensis]|uniref:hypothetical protein n=1 Tax=Photorhabdus antumapuensis TaxID=2862867 RepID=UPI001CEC48F9|nr:hypothetical protein [Photorhabdus antumapuensis]MCA6222782.1 hypothetical protein [Photorhabdus antumapuensis]
MNIDIIISLICLLVFFLSFLVFCRRNKLSLTSSISMNDFFSGIFFLRDENVSLWGGRISLFIGVPMIYFFKYFNNKSGSEFFPLIICTWGVAVYFRFSYNHSQYNKNRINTSLFYEFFITQKKGSQGLLLWIIRSSFVASMLYALLA